MNVYVRSQGGEGGYPVRTFCGQEESCSDVNDRTSSLFVAKHFGFFKIYLCVRTDKKRGGAEPVRTFCGQGGRRSIFHDFVRTSFMDGPLFLVSDTEQQSTPIIL